MTWGKRPAGEIRLSEGWDSFLGSCCTPWVVGDGHYLHFACRSSVLGSALSSLAAILGRTATLALLHSETLAESPSKEDTR